MPEVRPSGPQAAGEACEALVPRAVVRTRAHMPVEIHGHRLPAGQHPLMPLVADEQHQQVPPLLGHARGVGPHGGVTHGTLLVASARTWLDRLAAEGAEITEPPAEVPTGSGFTARHRDGTVIEYVEHRPTEEGL